MEVNTESFFKKTCWEQLAYTWRSRCRTFTTKLNLVDHAAGRVKLTALRCGKEASCTWPKTVNLRYPHFVCPSLLVDLSSCWPLPTHRLLCPLSSLPRFLPGALWLMWQEWAELLDLRFSEGSAWVWLFYLGSLRATDSQVSSYELQSLMIFAGNQAYFFKIFVQQKLSKKPAFVISSLGLGPM